MNIFFYHVPRTGGLSVCKWFQSLESWDYQWFDRNKDELSEAVITPENELFSGHYEWGAHQEIDESMNCITVLRHPSKKLMSSYYKSQNTDRIGDNETFEEYINSNRNIRNLQTKQIAGEGYYTETNKNGAVLFSRACRNLNNCLWVGTTNNLGSDLNILSNRLDVEYREPDHHHNSNRPGIESIDQELYDQIVAENRLDYDLWKIAETHF